jgi:hypothetical protein
MSHAIFQLDPITKAVRTMMEAGYAKEVILGSLKIDENDLKKHLNYLYARVFDISCKNWMNHETQNLTFIRIQEQWMNDRLKAIGYLFLNEVYDALGLPRSAQGQLVGWFRAPYSNVVEIEIVDNTQDGGFILAFNPDGVIYNKLSTF